MLDALKLLLEARIAEARTRFGSAPQATEPRALGEDPFAALPAESRMEARIAKSLGVRPPEVERTHRVESLRRELAELERAHPNDTAAILALRRALRDAEVERNVLLESMGHALLVPLFDARAEEPSDVAAEDASGDDDPSR